MVVTSQEANTSVNFWLPEIPGVAENASSPYIFEPKDLKTGLFTGLEVSHEPGQWAVWAGVVLMAIGLTFVFYVIHMRFWVVPVQDAEGESGALGWRLGEPQPRRLRTQFKKLVEADQERTEAGNRGRRLQATTIPGHRSPEDESG